jgi:hypothetical protein
MKNPQADDDDSKRMLDELVSRSLAYRSSGEFKALVEFTRRFPHLAPFNAMLLHVQNPGIKYALRAPIWETDYERRVKPAARPYVILRTMGPVAFVFDLSDTEPIKESLAPKIPAIAENPFPTKGQPPSGVFEKIKNACLSIGILTEERDYATDMAGRVERVEGKPYDFHVSLNIKHSTAQKLATLSHELGHVFCGHLGISEQGWWHGRSGMSKVVEEFEAEAVAYIIAERMALDIGSIAYLASYLQTNCELPNYSLEGVLKAAGEIEKMAAGRFRPKPKSGAK